MADDLKIAMYVNLASEEQAAALKNQFDNVVVSGIKMVASMATQGKPLPALETLTSAATGQTTTLQLTISGADIDTMTALAEEKAQMTPPAMP